MEDSESRTVGHVVYSPPISTGEKPNDYTMGWALCQLDPSKIKSVSGNVIDLGHDVSIDKVCQALNSTVENPYKFAYPPGRQWKINNTCISLDEMRHHKTFDENNYPALSVLKRGRTNFLSMYEYSTYIQHAVEKFILYHNGLSRS